MPPACFPMDKQGWGASPLLWLNSVSLKWHRFILYAVDQIYFPCCGLSSVFLLWLYSVSVFCCKEDCFQGCLWRFCRAAPGDRRSLSAERGCASSRARCASNALRARPAGVAGHQWRPFSNDRAGGETFNSVGDCRPPLSIVYYNPPPLEAGTPRLS